MVKMRIRRDLHIQEGDPELVIYLKSLLTTLNPEYVEAKTFGRWTGNIPQYIKQYTESDGELTLPRGQLEHLLMDLGRDWEINDQRVAPESEKIWPEGNIILRPDDQEIAVQELLSHHNGMLSAPAGSGKTVMGLEAARRLGLMTLWLTHRIELLGQVIEETVDLLEIPEDSIGLIHGKKWSIGEQLTIGMIPTLAKRDLSGLRDLFGTIFIDEAHRVPSKTFLRVVNSFAAKHIYGVTATAYRRDRLEPVMFNTIGPVVARIEHFDLFEEEHLMIPTIRCRQTGWNPSESRTMEYPDFMEAMVHDVNRNQLIVNDILAECKPGNSIIVLVTRTKHAEILTNMLQARGARCEFVVGAIDVDEEFEGGKKKKKAIPKEVRKQIVTDFKEEKIQVLVATYDLLSEGFNYPPLNRLFMAAPIKWKGKVVQSLGRIQRTAKDKDSAIAYDYIDGSIAMFANQAESRMYSVYTKMGMPVENF